MTELAEELVILRADNVSKSAEITNLKIAVEEDQFSSPENRAFGFIVDLTFGFIARLKMAVEVFSVKSCSV